MMVFALRVATSVLRVMDEFPSFLAARSAHFR
jgi:hypothetical protein